MPDEQHGRHSYLVLLAATIALLGIAAAIYTTGQPSQPQIQDVLLDVTGYCTPDGCSLVLDNHGDAAVYVSQINITDADSTVYTVELPVSLPVPPNSYGLLSIAPHENGTIVSYRTESHVYSFHYDNRATLGDPVYERMYTLDYVISSCDQLIPLELESYQLFVNETHAYYVEVNASLSGSRIVWADAKLLYMHDISVWEAFTSKPSTSYKTFLPLQHVPLWETSDVPSPATRAVLSLALEPMGDEGCSGQAFFTVYKTEPVGLTVYLADGTVVEDYVPLVPWQVETNSSMNG